MEFSQEVCEIYCRTFAYFYVDIDVLYLGGPELCQGGFPSNFTFDDNSSPKINITYCGVPQPKVNAEFIGEKLNVVNTTVNSYTHDYTLELPRLDQTVCGKELTATATGHNGTITDKIKIFLKNCKCGYYVYTLVLNHFKHFFSGERLCE